MPDRGRRHFQSPRNLPRGCSARFVEICENFLAGCCHFTEASGAVPGGVWKGFVTFQKVIILTFLILYKYFYVIKLLFWIEEYNK